MQSNLTQRRQVLDHLLKYGKITTLDAFREYNITRLSSYINILRNENKNITDVVKKANGKWWKEFYLNLEGKV